MWDMGIRVLDGQIFTFHQWNLIHIALDIEIIGIMQYGSIYWGRLMCKTMNYGEIWIFTAVKCLHHHS